MRRGIRYAWIGTIMAVLTLLLPTVVTIVARPTPAAALPTSSTTSTLDPSADGTGSSGTWSKGGTCAASYALCVGDYSDSSATYAIPPNKSNTAYKHFKFPASPADVGDITSVDVSFYAKENSAGLTGSMDTVNLEFTLTYPDEQTTQVIAPAVQSAALTTTTSLYTVTLTPNGTGIGKTTADSWHLKMAQKYTSVGGADTTAQAYIYSVRLTLHYNKAPGFMSQKGYIFENDDQASGVNVNSDTAQAAGNTAITSVKRGERMTLRTQMSNVTNTTASDMSLFYDRNDNYWTKVRSNVSPVTSSGSCSETNFSCTTVAGHYTTAPTATHVAVDPSGMPWISFYDANALDLIVAHYVGSGGSGCGANGSTAWSCETVVSTGDVGIYNNIVFDSSGNLWVAYYDTTNTTVMVAEHVPGANCALASWTCTSVKTITMYTTDQLGFTVGADGKPAITFDDGSTVHIARYVGSGGTNCSSSSWTACEAVDCCGDAQVSISTDQNGNLGWMEVANTNGLYAGTDTGTTSGSCSESWYTCATVTTDTVEYPSVAFAPDGNLWVSYHDTTNDDLMVANYVGSGGTGCVDSSWNCTIVDDNLSAHGAITSLAFDPAGHAWVTYQDTTNGRLKLARNVGASGTGCQAGITTWTCSTIDSVASKTLGGYSSLAFAPDGTAWISETNATDKDVRVINLNRAGEITSAPGIAGSSNGAGITTSHTDMTSVSDTTNQGDADCITGSWSNGKWFESPTATGLSIGAGNCTELGFNIDTSQAQSNTTYRFVVSTNDSPNYSHSYWRGPTAITQFPTLTTEAATTTRYSKDNSPDFANCTDTNWGCTVIDNTSDMGRYNSMAIDPAGTQWIAYYDNSADNLVVAHYVGTGGSGCGNTVWTCTAVDTGNDVGSYASIGIDLSGTPWVSYMDTTNSTVRVAQYVGTGGSGCASSAWTCTVVDSDNNETALTFDASGAPVVAYSTNAPSLKVARYVGSGGSGCTSPAWNCTTVDSSSGTERYASIAADTTGNLWISYRDSTAGSLKVAHQVGVGGSCSSTSWSCTTVDSTGGNNGWFSSIAIDSSGNPWISYQDWNNDYLKVAKYVTSSGTGCTSSAWTCTNVVTSVIAGNGTSIGFDSTGNAWVSYGVSASGFTVRAARYVGSSGTGCDSTAWTCTTLATQDGTRLWNTLAFDTNGTPWIAFVDSSLDLEVAKLHKPPNPLSNANRYTNGGRNAPRGDGRYRLDAGLSPRTSTCSATSNYKGYCGVLANDSDYDSIASNANEMPIYDFATRSASNTSFPNYSWIGQSNTAASTKNIKIEIYRFGTTNAWVTLNTNSTVSANSDFTLTGTATAGSASEYWESDGSNYWTYYRVYQAYGSETLKTNAFTAAAANAAPSTPASLAQTTTGGTTITNGSWTQTTKFTANLSDTNSSDTDYLCVEAEPVGTPFTYTETNCGSGVSYSGTPVAASVTLSLAGNTQYHWQARAKDAGGMYSSWVSYGSNSEGTAATPSHVQSASSGASVGNSVSLAFPGNTTAGNSIVVATLFNPTGTVTCSDTQGNTYAMALSYTAAGESSFICYALHIAGGADTVTVTNSVTTTNQRTMIHEYSNLGPVDVISTNTAAGTTTTDGTTSGTATTTNSNDLVFGFTFDVPSTNSITKGTGFTNRVSLNSDTLDEDKVLASAGSTAATFTYSTAHQYVAVMAAFSPSFSGTAATDFGVDTTAPTTGTVYDGASAGVDVNYNSGSLSSLSANWSGFSDSSSGITLYEYSIGTSAGGTQVLGWTSNSTTTSATASALTLQTNQIYYINVRATDAVGNVSTVVSSNGQFVAPTLTFSTSTNTTTFAHLNSGNSYTDSKTVDVTTSTNGYSGYVVRQYAPTPMTYGSSSIAAYGGTYASPTTWSGIGFGYTSNDTSIQASGNLFAGATKYAALASASPGDIVADHTSSVTGSAITNETFTLTYKIAIASNQAAGLYSTTIRLSAVATF